MMEVMTLAELVRIKPDPRTPNHMVIEAFNQAIMDYWSPTGKNAIFTMKQVNLLLEEQAVYVDNEVGNPELSTMLRQFLNFEIRGTVAVTEDLHVLFDMYLHRGRLEGSVNRRHPALGHGPLTFTFIPA